MIKRKKDYFDFDGNFNQIPEIEIKLKLKSALLFLVSSRTLWR